MIAKHRPVALTILAVLILGHGACDQSPPRRRAILIGIDGATLRLAGPLMDEGKLPNLAKLTREGVSGNIHSARPLFSPRIWNTISTGKHPREHGITAFSRKDEQGVHRLLLSTDRKVHSLWNIVSDAGLSVNVVNWWNTYPPDKINGIMISDHLFAARIRVLRMMTGALPVEPSGAAVYPERWQTRFKALLDKDILPVAFADPFEGNTSLPHWTDRGGMSRVFNDDAAVGRIALEVQQANDPDVMLVLLTGIDRVSHVLWGVLEPPELYPERLRPNDAERAAGAKALKGYYEFTDALIGKLIEGYGPEDLVIVVSDHGFEANAQFPNLTGGHLSDEALDGVFFARGRGIPAGEPVGEISIFDLTPTILAWLGLPPAKDMPGRVADFVREVELERVATYDTGTIERTSTAPSGADETMLEQLRALGYIE